jgi:transcriptional regulator with XRE-family HTH domain
MVPAAGRSRHDMAAFLRARRAALAPTQVGIDSGRTRVRRVNGLRREEVANLAGVSYSWYTRLEQGHDVHATAEVIDSIAAALRLSEDEHRHLRRLAGLPPQSGHERSESVDEYMLALLERLLPSPAYVLGPTSDYLAWNDALSAVFCNISALPAGHRNVLWATFIAPEVRSALVDWKEHARRVVGQFRAEAAAHPNDPRFGAIAGELAELSPEFERWWTGHEVVRASGGAQAFSHPDVGLLNTHLIQLRVLDSPTLKLIIHHPLGASDERKLLSLQGESTWTARLARP